MTAERLGEAEREGAAIGMDERRNNRYPVASMSGLFQLQLRLSSFSYLERIKP